MVDTWVAVYCFPYPGTAMNITNVLQELNIPVAPSEHHHRTTTFEQIDCPWCSKGSQRWRLGLAFNGKSASCWTCGVHDVLESLVEASGASFEYVLGLLKQLRYNDSNTIPKPARKKGKLVLPSGLGPLLPIHRQYLRSRGFHNSEQLTKLWNLQGFGIHSNFAWRIFIPVYLHGKMVSWTTRAVVDDVDKRYINASFDQEEISIKHVLLGMDFCRHTIVVCEGPFDAMRIGPGAVATCGISYTREQLRLMAYYPVRVICFDNEPQAQDRAKELCRNLDPFPGTTQNVVLDAKDPGSASQKEINELRKTFLED